jgi:hypothetical protein
LSTWALVHAGTFERPNEEWNFTAVFVSGPRDGQEPTFLAAIRSRPQRVTALFPGYHLHHEGEHAGRAADAVRRPNAAAARF